MANDISRQLADLLKPEPWEWRILVDCSPAASGREDSALECHRAVALCAMRMFDHDADDAMIQVRRPGEEWTTLDAAWGRGDVA